MKQFMYYILARTYSSLNMQTVKTIRKSKHDIHKNND